jgi:6-phosphogluconolactonase/glucosamine-6-phosphate isomerase/deaminase
VRTIVIDESAQTSAQRVGDALFDAWRSGALAGLGGATGRTMRGISARLLDRAAASRVSLRDVPVWFLDEYFGHATYLTYALQHLGTDRPEGFAPGSVRVPRGLFFDADDRRTSNADLERILEETRNVDWRPEGEAVGGEEPPIVRFAESPSHPVLREIAASCARFDRDVRTRGAGRTALLGIGTDGHVGFVERGAGLRESGTMLVRLAATTRRDNAADFALTDGDGHAVRLEPARFAVTQGIATIVSAASVWLVAHGAKKSAAVRRMLTEAAGPQNPAGYVAEHSDVRIFLDRGAWGTLDRHDLAAGDWTVTRA